MGLSACGLRHCGSRAMWPCGGSRTVSQRTLFGDCPPGPRSCGPAGAGPCASGACPPAAGCVGPAKLRGPRPGLRPTLGAADLAIAGRGAMGTAALRPHARTSPGLPRQASAPAARTQDLVAARRFQKAWRDERCEDLCSGMEPLLHAKSGKPRLRRLCVGSAQALRHDGYFIADGSLRGGACARGMCSWN